MREIPLTKGYVTQVSDEDYEWLIKYRWRAEKIGKYHYASTSFGKKTVRMHRLILEISDTKIQGDHIDHNTLNNQRENLRACSHQQNNANKPKKEGTTSKYKGVHWNSKHGRWVAAIRLDKQTGLGMFETEEAAAEAYNKEVVKRHGEFAVVNVIDWDNPNPKKSKPKRIPSSSYRGVLKKRNRWAAAIRHKNKTTSLGSFITEIEAAKAYNIAALRLHGSNAKLNSV